jgi:hypothetical protein
LSNPQRYVLEGQWSGYVERQRKIVHREVIGVRRAERLKKVKQIRYTDGTLLLLSVRPALHGEHVKEMAGYGGLIADAERAGETEFVVGRPLTRS